MRRRQRDQNVNQRHEHQDAVQNVPAGLKVALVPKAETESYNLQTQSHLAFSIRATGRKLLMHNENMSEYLNGHLCQEDHSEDIVGHTQEHSLLEGRAGLRLMGRSVDTEKQGALTKHG